jgi:hypothetical protein
MRVAAGTVGLATLAARALLLCVLPACDQIDVSSSVEPPSSRCASCHLPEFHATTHPPHEGVKPTTCGTCHSEHGFHPAQLVHSFPLDGAHANANCFACHTGAPAIFEGTPKACSMCHASERARADAAVAQHASFGDDCATCHGTQAWRPTLHESVQTATAPTVAMPHTSEIQPRERAPVAATAPPSGRTVPQPSRAPRPAPASRSGVTRAPDSVSGASPVRGRH